MSMPIRLWILAVVVTIVNGLNINTLFSNPLKNGEPSIVQGELDNFNKRLLELTDWYNHVSINFGILMDRIIEASKTAAKVKSDLYGTDPLILERHKQNRAERLEDEIILLRKKIDLKKPVYIDVEKERWSNAREIFGNSLIKVVCAATFIALFHYIVKHGMPVFMHHFTQPKVISETSKTGWFGRKKTKQTINSKDLVFSPLLQKQLADIFLRIQTAKQYKENFPNLLFFGTPGTGKTAFAKVLATESGLDYAITSGSEFTKITDLSVANDELRKLLDWAKNTQKGLVVFIDEAESLFINRKFSTTPKATQDFINTFLALISDQSQKDVMFILATNHPFKLDDSIANRIGISIEFTLPEEEEREEILFQYLVKFAQENKNAIVEIHPEITQKISEYAQNLESFSPRAIKFVAEDMIVKARRQGARLLTNNIAQLAIVQAKQNLQHDRLREKEREEWLRALPVH